MNTYNNELYHFGVKGMKWGVRRARDKQYIRNAQRSSVRRLNESDEKHTVHQYRKAYKQAGKDAKKELRERRTNGQSLYKRAVNKFVNSKIGSKYKLSDDPEKELREVEGTPPRIENKKTRVDKRTKGGTRTHFSAQAHNVGATVVRSMLINAATTPVSMVAGSRAAVGANYYAQIANLAVGAIDAYNISTKY